MNDHVNIDEEWRGQAAYTARRPQQHSEDPADDVTVSCIVMPSETCRAKIRLSGSSTLHRDTC